MDNYYSAQTVVHPLLSPKTLRDRIPLSIEEAAFVHQSRKTLKAIINGHDPRLLLIVGPCSIHDVDAGLEYAQALKALADEVAETVFIVMRVYYEKPRTSSGWKGLIVDPHLNGEADIAGGLHRARQFLKQIAHIGLPAATEFIDPLTPLYIGDCISWAAIGARTAESPTHRHLASGLPMPVGFKNNTAGCLKSAVFAMEAARSVQNYLGINEHGQASALTSAGNAHVHLVLRGGHFGPNYRPTQVAEAAELLATHGFRPTLMVDCSHGNSAKNHALQPEVYREILRQLAAGSPYIAGLMLESHLSPGSQPFPQPHKNLRYGVSITDACVDLPTTAALIRETHAVMLNRLSLT